MSAARNPFRSERVIALPYQPQNTDWETLLQRLEAMHWHGAVVGPCGTGKTTLFDRLEPELDGRDFNVHAVRLDTQTRQLPPELLAKSWGSHDAILLDGAEQLSWLAWQRFKAKVRPAGALIITSHRSGLLPTWLQTSTDTQLLESLCHQLGAPFPEAELNAIFERHRGNLRLCLMELYDRAAKNSSPGP